MQNKGFTLVELIVVITILAILGTIAFISLQGYSTDAKNSKVTSDLKNIASALEAKRTQSSTTLASFLNNDLSANNSVSGTFGSGVTLAAGTNYGVGNMSFTTLGQNGSDFKDPNGGNADYLFAYGTVTGHSGYQLAGQIVEDDVKEARVIGNYYEKVASDVDGLISARVGAAASTQLADGTTIGSGDDATDYLY